MVALLVVLGVTERAHKMVEECHGAAREEDAAVALFEAKVKDGDVEAMWMLGVCCEYGVGMKQDAHRAEELYKSAAEQGNATAKRLSCELDDKKEFRRMEMDLEGGQMWKKQTIEP